MSPDVAPNGVAKAGALEIPGVTFRTVLQGRYIGAQGNGGGAVNATATVAQAWEMFTLDDINGGDLQSGDQVFIHAGNGQLFMAVNGGGSTLSAGSNNLLEWETFKVVKKSGSGVIRNGDVVGLQTFSGSWVSAEQGGGGPVFAYGGALGSWEELTIGVLGGSTTPPGQPPVAPPPPVQPPGGGGGNPPNVPGQPTLPNGRGATMPFVEYEAENMTTNGQQLGPTRTFGQSAAEASGRRAVRLGGTGQFVQFTNTTPSNSIVVRYSIPDGGPDYWVSLGVYVNGAFRTRLSLTSRYSWTYGNPHHFYDEAHAMVGDIPVGATVMVRKDGEDAARYYDIDLVDMEQVGGPIGQPGGFLSLTGDCGGTPNDNSDDSGALQRCVDRARGEGRGVYIPPGVFNSHSRPISVAGVTIRGAGMWHSTVAGYHAHFDCWGNNCQYYDFAVFGDSTQRIDTATDAAFGGAASAGAVLDHIWVEHSRVGYFTGSNANNMVVRNSRFRNLLADGVNLYGGSSNCIIENNHARNTGDDAFAAWSHGANGQGPDTNNIFRHNYVQLPWKANCFALYGGRDNQITDNVCADVVQYPGILLSRQFDSVPFSGITTIARNTLIRAGAWAYNQEQGALKIHADQAGIGGVRVTDLDIDSPTFFAVHVQGRNGMGDITMSNITVTNPGQGVFFLNWGANGSMFVERVGATGSPRGVRDDTGGAFNLMRGSGNWGW